MAMLEVKDLHTSFFTPAGEVKAVNGVSYNMFADDVILPLESWDIELQWGTEFFDLAQ